MSWPCRFKALVDGTYKAWKFRKARLPRPCRVNTTTARLWAESSEDVLPGTLWCRTSWLTPLWLPHWGKGCWDGNRNIHSGFPLLACWNFVSSAFIKSKEITMTREKKRRSQQIHRKRERRGSTFGRRHVFEWRRGDVLWGAGCGKHFWRCLLYSSLCSPWDTEQNSHTYLFYLFFFAAAPSHTYLYREVSSRKFQNLPSWFWALDKSNTSWVIWNASPNLSFFKWQSKESKQPHGVRGREKWDHINI